MSQMQSSIGELFDNHKKDSASDDCGDVVFALFLKPHSNADETFFNRVLNFGIQHLQPSPVMVHVELIVPCSAGSKQPCIFATYIGSKSDWKCDNASNESYYFGDTAGKWLAVPIFGRNAAKAVRDVCDVSRNVPYSMFRYATALYGLRNFANLVKENTRSPAHCATITARILKEALGKKTLSHSSAWYGPASLYGELVESLRNQHIRTDGQLVNQKVVEDIDTLLQMPDSDVKACSDARSFNAIRALTLKAAMSAASPDGTEFLLAQKQLATALLRWTTLRDVAAI